MSVAFALVTVSWCASRPVIQAFVFDLLCVALHPVLGFLTGSCPVGFAGRNHEMRRIIWAQVSALLDLSGLPCVRSFCGFSDVSLSYPWV